MKPQVVVDTRGFFCPVPIIRVSEALRNLDTGGLVEVIADDPAIEVDLPAWCWSNGHTIRESRKESGVHRFLVEKGGAQEPGV